MNMRLCALFLGALLVASSSGALAIDSRKPCTRDYKPVCASDGNVYANPCVAEAADTSVLFDCLGDEECGDVCEALVKAPKATGPCPRSFEPVCGKDGKVYPNSCTAKAARQRVRYECADLYGDCEADCAAFDVRGCRCRTRNSRRSAVCARSGKVYSSSCLLGCARATKRFDCKNKRDCAQDCEHAAASCPCQLSYLPVCGRSGVVHANECVAKCLDRVAFPCDGLPEAKCQRRCMAASLRRYG